MSVADILAGALELPQVQAQECPPDSRCVVTGERITVGVPSTDVITSATTEFLDAFRGGVDGWVSTNAARCFKSAAPALGAPCGKSVLAFADGAAWQPLISAKSAGEQSRPCWRDVVREVWPVRQGQQCFCLLTVDTKKRLWHKGRVGVLGNGMVAYIHDGYISQNATLSWPGVLQCLDMCEAAYRLGWSKRSIGGSLYEQHAVMENVGIHETRRMDAELGQWRGSHEMRFALLIAQKEAVA